MISKDYNSVILKKVEWSFDKLMPVCAIVAWVSSIAILYSSIPVRFAIIDGLSGTIFMLLSIYRKFIRVELKIVFTIVNPVVIGLLSFLDGGFSGAGITLIMIGNVVAVLFLKHAKSIMVSLMSVSIFLFLWFWSVKVKVEGFVNENTAVWVIQFVTFILYLFIIHTIVYAVRKYLLENIEDLDVSTDQIYNLAYYDQLTGLPNQYLFREILERKMTINKTRGLLVFMNVKNLDLINSLYSDALGDEVIQEISRIFTKIKREHDLFARIDGNEYALWIEDIKNKNIDDDQRLDYYFEFFDQMFRVPNMVKKVEFHVGYSRFSKRSNLEECFKKTTLALSYAKNHEWLGPVAYDGKLDEMIRYEEDMKELLVEAIKNRNEEFSMSYQPKVNSYKNQVVGVEALARWNCGELGSVGPAKFIPVIEKMNMAEVFGEIVIKKAFRDYSNLCIKYENQLKLAINISPPHFVAEGFDKFVKTCLEEYRISPDRVILEITEEVMIEDLKLIQDVIKKLKNIGVKISLDDFGSGYSSLNYLSVLDIDELKIDKSFVDQIANNERIEIMLESIIALASSYQLNVVAEGVETKKQFLKLMILGCTEIQGFYFSKPEPL